LKNGNFAADICTTYFWLLCHKTQTTEPLPINAALSVLPTNFKAILPKSSAAGEKKFGPSEYLLIESNVIDFFNNPPCNMVREN
jgi:hypothetical protein